MADRMDGNVNDLSQYKGEIRKCPACLKGQDTLGVACRICLGNHFVAVCLNCQGTGKFKGSTVWDGGRNEHQSTCNQCGGSGYFPARKPADWQDDDTPSAPRPKKDAVAQAAALAGPFAGNDPEPDKLPPPPSMQDGAVLPGGVVVK